MFIKHPIRYALEKKNDIIWEFFPTWGGGVFPNPKTFVKGLKMLFLYYIRLKMDPEDHIIDQKGQKMYENRQKNRVFRLKKLLFSGIFSS